MTALIARARAGSDEDRNALVDAIYDEVRAIAGTARYAGRHGDTLQPTAIAGEFFVELCRRFPPPPESVPESRATFFRSVALAVRQIIREHWRRAQADRRGGGHVPASLEEQAVGGAAHGAPAVDALALDVALDDLERYNLRWYNVVMHRYYAGRTVEETAMLLGTAPSTVAADWRLARAWLARRLETPA